MPRLLPATVWPLRQASRLHPESAGDALQGSLWLWCYRSGYSSKEYPGPWKDLGPSLGGPQRSGPACRILDTEIGNDSGHLLQFPFGSTLSCPGFLGSLHISMRLGAFWSITAGTFNRRHTIKTAREVEGSSLCKVKSHSQLS